MLDEVADTVREIDSNGVADGVAERPLVSVDDAVWTGDTDSDVERDLVGGGMRVLERVRVGGGVRVRVMDRVAWSVSDADCVPGFDTVSEIVGEIESVGRSDSDAD